MPPLAILLPQGTRGHRPNLAPVPAPPFSPVPPRVPGPTSPARPRRPPLHPPRPGERPEPRKQRWRPPGEPVALFPAPLTPSSLSLPLPAAAAASCSAMAAHAGTAAKRHRVSRRAPAPCRKARRRDVQVAMAAGPEGGAGEAAGTEGTREGRTAPRPPRDPPGHRGPQQLCGSSLHP